MFTLHKTLNPFGQIKLSNNTITRKYVYMNTQLQFTRILIPVPCIFYYFVLWPTNAQLFHKLSHSYMFRHYRVTLRKILINTMLSYTSISNAAVGNTVNNFLFCAMTNKCTIISQIITLLHVSTLSCHPQEDFNQHLAKLHRYFKCSCW